MADSDNNKLSVEEQVARIKAAKEAAKLAAAEKAAASGVAPAAPAPVAKAADAPVAPAPVAAAAPVAAPAPGSVEEQVAKIKAAKAAAAEKAKADAAAKAASGSPAPATTAAPAPGSVEEQVAKIKAAKAAAAEKAKAEAAAKATGGAVAAAAPVVAAASKFTEPGTPEAIAKAAAAHASFQGATGTEGRGTLANKPAKELLANVKPAAAAAKPAAPKKEVQDGPLPPPPQMAPRRAFLGFLTLGTVTWAFFFTWLAGIGHLFLRFMFPNVLYEADPKFNAGRKNDYPEAPKVYERFTQEQAVWLVRLNEEGQDRLVALSTVCTHLGCTPNWLQTELKYKCPCHGSGYYMNGVNFEGPTPRPLERFRIYIDVTGNIIVDKSKKYRQDLQQWNENQSYLPMA